MGQALVTGSAGFVGQHFVRYLHEDGWKVHAIDVKTGHDALDFFANRYDPFSYDLVVHCAANVGGRRVIEHTPFAQAHNLELDVALFRWARRTRPGRILYFSSSAAYPVSLQHASIRHSLEEKDIDLDGGPNFGKPDQLYGWSKLTGELLAAQARDDGLAVTVVRPFSGYGEDQEDCYPFPAFIDRALRREDPFLIWGDGTQVRDFIHIDDIVGACMALYQADENGPVNLGYGQGHSMNELALRICATAGYEPQFEHSSLDPVGMQYRVSKADRKSVV